MDAAFPAVLPREEGPLKPHFRPVPAFRTALPRMKQSVGISSTTIPSSRRCYDHIHADGMPEKCAYSIPVKCLQHLSKPNTIILDYHLDSVQKSAANGLAIPEKIRKHDRNVHIIVLSSQTRYAVAAETIAKGAEQYVIKDDEAFSQDRRDAAGIRSRFQPKFSSLKRKFYSLYLAIILDFHTYKDYF